MKTIDNRRDILLLLLYSPGNSPQINEPIVGRTRLVKMIFLFKNEVWKKFKGNIPLTEDNMYEFFAWNYGPFSSDVYTDITFFILRGFIERNYSNQESLIESVEEWNFWLKTYADENAAKEYQEEEFKLTEKGISFTNELYDSLSDNQKNILKEYKARISNMPLRALLRYVYREYPNQTTKSVIKDDILGHQ